MRTKKHFTVKPFTNSTSSASWRVSGYLDGKQIRENFTDKLQALSRAAELEVERDHVAHLVTLKPTPLSDAQLADAQSALLRLDGRASLYEAADFYLRHYRPGVGEKPMTGALAEFLAEKQASNLRPRAVENLKFRIGRFVAAHPGKMVCEIQAADIRAAVFVSNWKPATSHNERRALSCFFNWCVKRGYAGENPVAKVDPPRLERGEPVILSIRQVGNLLAASLTHKAGILTPYLALAFFAGLRPCELQRVKWSDIDLEGKTLVVRSAAAKLRARRLVELPDNLIPWLGLHFDKTAIYPLNWRKDFDSVRRLAGFRGSWAKKGDESRTPWASDVIRHTSLSYRLALVKHEGEAARWAGNSPQVLFTHYAGIVREADAKAYWQLTPATVLADVNGCLREKIAA